MSSRDAEGRSVYDNAPDEKFIDWLNSLKPVDRLQTLFDGCEFATTTQTVNIHDWIVPGNTLSKSNPVYYDRLFA